MNRGAQGVAVLDGMELCSQGLPAHCCPCVQLYCRLYVLLAPPVCCIAARHAPGSWNCLTPGTLLTDRPITPMLIILYHNQHPGAPVPASMVPRSVLP
jgi:hypothetical protein